MNNTRTPSAAILIIGNEILTGRTLDKNAPFLTRELLNLGIKVREIRTIPDEIDTIIRVVQELSHAHDYVFSTGGLGPTHDDVTAQSMAKAFDLPFEIHEEADQILLDRYGDNYTDARRRMAHMPRGIKLLYNPASAAPGFIVENIYVLPGVPDIMQSMFRLFSKDITPGAPLYSSSVTLHYPESSVSDPLRILQDRYPDVDLGSYPFFKQGHVGTCIVARSTDEKKLNDVIAQLEVMKPTQAI